ncbi:MAG TPA: hypothetical protein H9894_01200 [Candidatus Desulfovibrio intestinipullorum]|uniref:Uncharacterized protein n=1 Tax=Candidatus Desulfovibrio intestinipullorum TaxID=2838536 RepID=A0A9D1PUY4_9BACT|nr:hypothetical protein [Candidatus Desulfovibrio intestinipullorum]
MEGWTSEKAVYFPVLSCLFRIESGSETAATDTKPFFLSQDSFLLHRKAFFSLVALHSRTGRTIPGLARQYTVALPGNSLKNIQ